MSDLESITFDGSEESGSEESDRVIESRIQRLKSLEQKFKSRYFFLLKPNAHSSYKSLQQPDKECCIDLIRGYLGNLNSIEDTDIDFFKNFAYVSVNVAINGNDINDLLPALIDFSEKAIKKLGGNNKNLKEKEIKLKSRLLNYLGNFYHKHYTHLSKPWAPNSSNDVVFLNKSYDCYAQAAKLVDTCLEDDINYAIHIHYSAAHIAGLISEKERMNEHINPAKKAKNNALKHYARCLALYNLIKISSGKPLAPALVTIMEKSISNTAKLTEMWSFFHNSKFKAKKGRPKYSKKNKTWDGGYNKKYRQNFEQDINDYGYK